MEPHFRSESLQREVEEQRELISRLNAELRKYQMMAGLEPPGYHDHANEEPLPPWAANAVFLSPLLASYDVRVKELETALVHSRQDLEGFMATAKQLTNENQTLREQLERKWSEGLDKDRFDGDGANLAMLIEEKTEMEERLDLLSTENNLLLEQLDAFKSRNSYLEKLAGDRSRTAEHLLEQLKHLSGEYNALKVEFEEVQANKEFAESKLKRVQESLGTLEREREEAITTINKLQNEARLSEQQAQYYKKAYEDVDRTKSEEIDALYQEVHAANSREKEAVNRALVQERESEEAREQSTYYKREFESIRAECDSMLKIMEDYEQKIATFQQKEDSVHQIARDARQKVEEALLERDRVALRESQYTKQIDRLQEQLRSDIYEQKVKYEGLIEAMRKKQQSLLAARDEEVATLADRTTVNQAQIDRLQREVSSLTSEKQRADALFEEEQKRVEHRLSDYEKKFRDIEELRLSERRLLENQGLQFSYERQEWERLKKNLEFSLNNSQKEVETQRTSNKRSLEEAKRTKAQHDDVARERDRLIEELNSIRDAYYERVNEVANEYNAKVAQLERQIQDARELQKNSEEKAFALLKAQEKVSEKWKSEHQQTVSYFEKLVQELNDENKRLVKQAGFLK